MLHTSGKCSHFKQTPFPYYHSGRQHDTSVRQYPAYFRIRIRYHIRTKYIPLNRFSQNYATLSGAPYRSVPHISTGPNGSMHMLSSFDSSTIPHLIHFFVSSRSSIQQWSSIQLCSLKCYCITNLRKRDKK